MEIQKVVTNIITEVPEKIGQISTVQLPTPLKKDTFQRSEELLSQISQKVKKSTLDSLIQTFSAKKYKMDFEYLYTNPKDYLTNLIKIEEDANIVKLLIDKKYFKYGFSADSIEIILEKSKNARYKNIVLDLCKSKKCIIPVFERDYNESLFERLYIMKNSTPEKYKKIINSKNLLDFYERDITWDAGCKYSSSYKPFLKTSLLEDLDVSNFSNVEKIYNKFTKWATSETLDCDPHKLTYLYFKKPKIYDYLVKHPYLLKNCHTVYEVPSIEILEEINKSGEPLGAFSAYVFNNHLISKQTAQELSKLLEKYKLSNDVIMYRGDGNLLFSNISIKDSPIEKLIKKIIINNPNLAKNEQVYRMGKKQNLYDYILTQKDLSLEDAMDLLSAGYQDENLIKSIENTIKHSTIIDDRLKSVTVSEVIANGCGSICSKFTIKKGTECAFICDKQQEFVLSANPRKITFTNAIFDPETRSFKLEATIEPAGKQ